MVRAGGRNNSIELSGAKKAAALTLLSLADATLSPHILEARMCRGVEAPHVTLPPVVLECAKRLN